MNSKRPAKLENVREKTITYYGLGFPVVLCGFPMKKYWGEDMPDINYNELKRAVIELLVRKPWPLTGNEIRFIRQYFEMNYTEFGKHFGQTRQAVTKWEEKEDHFAAITRSTELHIRLAILDLLKANNKVFRQIFHEFDQNEELKSKKHYHEPLPISVTPSELKCL